MKKLKAEDKLPLKADGSLDYDAPIAIVGGGPSGILFASQQLLREGQGDTKLRLCS